MMSGEKRREKGRKERNKGQGKPNTLERNKANRKEKGIDELSVRKP